MKIGELAKRNGLTAYNIRFYESDGLLHTVERQAWRSPIGYRDYPAGVQVKCCMLGCAAMLG